MPTPLFAKHAMVVSDYQEAHAHSVPLTPSRTAQELVKTVPLTLSLPPVLFHALHVHLQSPTALHAVTLPLALNVQEDFLFLETLAPNVQLEPSLMVRKTARTVLLDLSLLLEPLPVLPAAMAVLNVPQHLLVLPVTPVSV